MRASKRSRSRSHSSPSPDEGLLQRYLVHHDRAALISLIKRNLDLAYRAAYRITAHEELSEEATQEAGHPEHE